LIDKNTKKQVPLRISPQLWNDLSAWAEDEFRSLNGQIEYLLTECVKGRKSRPKNPGALAAQASSAAQSASSAPRNTGEPPT